MVGKAILFRLLREQGKTATLSLLNAGLSSLALHLFSSIFIKLLELMVKKQAALLTLILLFIFFLSKPFHAQSPLIPEVLDAETGDCTFGAPLDETLGVTIHCGQIEVPQNWAEPDGQVVTIAYAILRSKSISPFLDPVIYFEGGPGGSALNGLVSLSDGLAKLRENRDVVIWDQRGTTFSNELFCPETVQITEPETYDENKSEVESRFEALKINAYSDPDIVRDIVVEYAQLADRSRCLTYLEAQGIDLTQYSTENTVLDALALMKHLAYPAYNLYGVSYGSTVALALMDYYSSYPEANLPALRSGVIEGIAPRNRSWIETGYEQVWTMLRVFVQCEDDRNCAASYPDIRQRAIDLTAKLQDAPLMGSNQDEVTLEDVLAILRGAVSTSSLARPFLPRMIAELEQGETATFEVLQAALTYSISLPSSVTEAESPRTNGLNGQLEQLDEQFDAIREQVGLLIVANQILSEAILDGESHPEQFLAILEKYLESVSNVRLLLLNALHAPSIHPEQRTRENLRSLVSSNVFLPKVEEELQSLIDRMSDEDVADVYTELTRAAFKRELVTITSLTNRVVDCNYFGNTMFNELAFETYPNFEAPHLIGPEAYWPASYQYSCEQLGLAAKDYSPPPPAVKSNLRTLILNGTLDTATPAEYAERAREGLSNAELIVMPEVAHGFSVLGDKCGQALVNAFVLSPNEELNRGCAEAKRIVFVLPDEDLPVLPEE